MGSVQHLSLLDLAGRDVSWWYVIFCDSEEPRWWIQRLKKNFRHVQLWRPVQFGPALHEKFWLVVDPGLEHVDTKIDWNPTPPWERAADITAMRVQAAVRKKKVRDYFFFGPITCVELAKAQLGICSAWVRTPWQLAKYLRAHKHTLILR
jgi:hypothetical protein